VSQTNTPVGTARPPAPRVDQASAWTQPSADGHPDGGTRHRIASLVAGGILSVLAVVLIAGGGWALWVHNVDRDAAGFVSVGTATNLQTDTYAITSKLRGDGPDWIYGSTLFGTGRVRATSLNGKPIFMGIARTSDVSRYMAGAGHATIEHLDTNDLTTHAGGAPSNPPPETSMWAVSTKGTGRQTLRWKPRDGNWSIVIMNANASGGVAVRGDLAAKFPLLPWVAGGLLIAGAVAGGFGGWLLVRGLRRGGAHG
jgi:hypothetical protein